MILERVLNNNAIVARDDDGKEYILFAKGVAYDYSKGEKIPRDRIERLFHQKEQGHLQQLMESISQKYFDLTCEIIEYIQDNMKIKLTNSVYIALMDHISFIKERAEMNALPKNNLKWEIIRYYPEEYHLSRKVVELLEDELEIELNDDEAANITLHIVNAEIGGRSLDNGSKYIELIDDILKIICFQANIEMNEDDLDYHRLTTHVKFFIQRLIQGDKYKDTNDIHDVIINKYKEAYEIAIKVKCFVEKVLACTISENEITYLVIHIARVLEK